MSSIPPPLDDDDAPGGAAVILSIISSFSSFNPTQATMLVCRIMRVCVFFLAVFIVMLYFLKHSTQRRKKKETFRGEKC